MFGTTFNVNLLVIYCQEMWEPYFGYHLEVKWLGIDSPHPPQYTVYEGLRGWVLISLTPISIRYMKG